MTDLFNLTGDRFNIEAVCPYYLPESQSWATWRRDERGRAIVSGYDPNEDERNHWLCHCGHFTTDGYCHCVACGGESPWGCDCGARDEDYDEEDDLAETESIEDDPDLGFHLESIEDDFVELRYGYPIEPESVDDDDDGRLTGYESFR